MPERLRTANGRLHNLKCEHAKSKTCKCSCNGSFHGIKRASNNADWTHGKPIGADLGGELGETINNLSGKEFLCLGVCRKPIKAIGWLGKEHDGGLADKTGKKWWLWIECDNCHYQTAWWKIPNRIKQLEIEQKHKQELLALKKEYEN